MDTKKAFEILRREFAMRSAEKTDASDRDDMRKLSLAMIESLDATIEAMEQQ